MKMAWGEAKSLDESLVSLDSFFSEQPKIAELLGGGLSSRCWKVVAQDDQCYVWRSASSHAFQFGLSRVRENQLLESLRDCQFAPNPIYLNRQGLLVEWLDGKTGSGEFSHDDIISMLASIHSLDIHNRPIPLFNFTAQVDGYWHKINQERKTPELEAIYLRWRELPNLPSVDSTLCHFDFGDYNLVSTKAGLRVIDWEYAGVGDPRMDLAMTLDLACMPIPQSVVNYCTYRGIDDADGWIIGVDQWRPRNKMMSLLWYLLGYQIWQDDFYLKQAEDVQSQLILV